MASMMKTSLSRENFNESSWGRPSSSIQWAPSNFTMMLVSGAGMPSNWCSAPGRPRDPQAVGYQPRRCWRCGCRSGSQRRRHGYRPASLPGPGGVSKECDNGEGLPPSDVPRWSTSNTQDIGPTHAGRAELGSNGICWPRCAVVMKARRCPGPQRQYRAARRPEQGARPGLNAPHGSAQ